MRWRRTRSRLRARLTAEAADRLRPTWQPVAHAVISASSSRNCSPISSLYCCTSRPGRSRDQGLIRRIGLSGASPEMLARAQKMTSIAAVQNRFNLLDRSGVQVLADCEAQGITFVPYFPLASGQLTSHDELTGPAERLGVRSAQVALAWLLRCSHAIVVIPGTANPDHLRANIAAAEVAKNLTDAEVARLTGLADESGAVLIVLEAEVRIHN